MDNKSTRYSISPTKKRYEYDQTGIKEPGTENNATSKAPEAITRQKAMP
jgi:hypothetical protein